MANTFHLQVVTPGGIRVDEQVESCIVRTTEGDFGILKGTADHMAAVEVGQMKVKGAEGSYRIAAANDGFVQISAEGAKIVVTTFEWAEEIDSQRAANAKEEAQRQLENPNLDPSERKLAEYRLKKARTRLRIAGAQS